MQIVHNHFQIHIFSENHKRGMKQKNVANSCGEMDSFQLLDGNLLSAVYFETKPNQIKPNITLEVLPVCSDLPDYRIVQSIL